MKRFVSIVTAGAIALSGATVLGVSAASADSTTTTTTTLGPPIQGAANLPIYLNVDTVVGGHASSANVTPAVGCAQTNEFLVGQTVVFRMSGVNVATGGTPLTPKNVVSANVVIPGVSTPLSMGYGNHGTVAFWTVGWDTTGYATLGVVNFKIVVTTAKVPAKFKKVRVKLKSGKYVMRKKLVKRAVPGATFTYTQAGTSANSQLTLNAAPTA